MNFNQFMEENTITITKDREKLELGAIYGEKLTLNGFELIADYCILTFEEYPKNFVFGNGIMADLLEKFADAVGGVKKANELLAQDGGNVVIEQKKSKTNNRMYSVMVMQ